MSEDSTTMTTESHTMIAQMVVDMREEGELRTALDTAVESIFGRQFSDAFCYHGGPKDYWRDVENEWRYTTDGEPIPTKYRTNKSVIMKAWDKSTRISTWYDPHGKVMGKSAIQNRLSSSGKLTREGAIKKIIHIIQQVERDQGTLEGGKLCKELNLLLEGPIF